MPSALKYVSLNYVSETERYMIQIPNSHSKKNNTIWKPLWFLVRIAVVVVSRWPRIRQISHGSHQSIYNSESFSLCTFYIEYYRLRSTYTFYVAPVIIYFIRASRKLFPARHLWLLRGKYYRTIYLLLFFSF